VIRVAPRPVAVLDDLDHIVTLLGPEGLQAPIVENEQLDPAQGTHQARIASVTAGQCQIGEHAWDALIEDRAIVAAGLVPECAGKPTFADAGRPFDDQVLRLIDPATADH
jgi:hypothetical protein